MKKKTVAATVFSFVSLLIFAGSAFAQDPTSEIRESTDPEKIAAIEQRARELQARQQNMSSGDQTVSEEATSRKPNKAHSKRHAAQSGKAKQVGNASGMSDTSNTSSTANSTSGTSSNATTQGAGADADTRSSIGK